MTSPTLRRSTLVVAGLAASLLTGAGAIAQDDVRFTVTEHALTDAVIDLGEDGDSLGDLLVFGNELYDEADETLVGRDQGVCFRTNPGLSWECTWTNLFDDGSIAVQGPFYDDLRESVLAITGGTGRYAGAAGTMILRTLDPGGTRLAFVFDLEDDGDEGVPDGDDGDG